MPTLAELKAAAEQIQTESTPGANTAARVGGFLLDLISHFQKLGGFTFSSGDFNVEVEANEEPQEITLYTLDFAALPDVVGEYGAGGDSSANCTGHIEVWVCMLDGGSGAGTNKEWWFTQKVQRRDGGNIETRGPIVFDPRSDVYDEEVEGDIDPEFAFVSGETMAITMTTPVPNNVSRLVVRVRGKLTNQVRA